MEEKSLREQAEGECKKILNIECYNVLCFPEKLDAAIIKLFVENKDNEIIRRAYVKLHKDGWVL